MIKPTNDEKSQFRVARGGSWYYYARITRVSNRNGSFPDYGYDFFGFRIVRNAS